MNRYFGRIVTRSESHSRQANSSTLFAAVSPGGGRSDVFDMEVFLASRRLSARSARHRCWSALERFDLRAFASVPAKRVPTVDPRPGLAAPFRLVVWCKNCNHWRILTISIRRPRRLFSADFRENLVEQPLSL